MATWDVKIKHTSPGGGIKVHAIRRHNTGERAYAFHFVPIEGRKPKDIKKDIIAELRRQADVFEKAQVEEAKRQKADDLKGAGWDKAISAALDAQEPYEKPLPDIEPGAEEPA